MSYVKFSRQIEKDWKRFGARASEHITAAAKFGWKKAVSVTPVRTGLLRHSWKLTTGRRSSYVPRPGKRPKPTMPPFRFRVTKDNRILLYNNTPYASYVENGLGPGLRTPRMMLAQATISMDRELKQRLRTLK